jgi:soluble lytic murein transglycosylase-like protein
VSVAAAAAAARVAEIQQLVAGALPSQAPASTGAFAAQLASAAKPVASAATANAAAVGPNTATFGAGINAAGGAGAPAGTGVSELPAGTPYGAEITAAAQRHGLDPALLAGLVKQESAFNPDAVSPAGARGLTQLMPGTAAGLGVTNPLDPAQALEGGAKYLREQLDRFGGDVARALAAYNAGPGAVQRYGGVPPYAETQNYVRAVQSHAATFRAPASIL